MKCSTRPSRPPRPEGKRIINKERLEEMMETAKIYADFPCGVTLNEISAKDIYAALQELKEYRESELRPVDKYFTNTLEQQVNHIEEEIYEVKEALHEWRRHRAFQSNPEQIEIAWEHIKEELTDVKTSCETMLAIMGLDAAARRAEVRKVNAKNERRKYFDRTE